MRFGPIGSKLDLCRMEKFNASEPVDQGGPKPEHAARGGWRRGNDDGRPGGQLLRPGRDRRTDMGVDYTAGDARRRLRLGPARLLTAWLANCPRTARERARKALLREI